MTQPRRALRLLLVPLFAAALACDAGGELFPPSGSVRLQLQDSGLVIQNLVTPGFQVTVWSISSATADIQGFGTFDFLQGHAPCAFMDHVLLNDDLARTCRGSGLALAPGPGRGMLHLTITAIEARRILFPDLTPESDPDADGVITRGDNCPVIANPGQEDTNGDGAGDDCSVVDPSFLDEIPDQDADGIADGFDNCQFTANADQRDVRRGPDLIGDACEQFTEVLLPDGPLQLDFPVLFEVKNSVVTLFLVDFDSRVGFSCDASFTHCRINPAAIRISIVEQG